MPNYHLWDDYVPDPYHWIDGEKLPFTPELYSKVKEDEAQREIHDTAQNCISRAMSEIGWVVYVTNDYVYPMSDTLSHRTGYYAEIERVPLEFDCTPSLEMYAAGLVPLPTNGDKSVIRTRVWGVHPSKPLLSEVITITQTKFKPLPRSWYDHEPPWLITPAQWQEDQHAKADRMRKVLEQQGYKVT